MEQPYKYFSQRHINTGGGDFIGGDVYCQSLSFANRLDSIRSLNEYKSSNKMHFLCDDIGFYGRVKEIEWLNEFCMQSDPILYTIVHGVGGIGKSKLLYEYMKNNYDSEWKMCFLTDAVLSSILNYNDYSYPKNLFIVIDYAARYAQLLGKWITKILEMRQTEKKVRLIMVERYVVLSENPCKTYYPWLMEFYGSPHQKRILQRAEYDFLELKQIDCKDLFQLIDNYAAMEMPTKNLSIEEKQNIISFSSDRQTPLIILLATDAFLNGRPYRQWDLTSVVQDYVDRLLDSWLTALCSNDSCIFRSLVNVLVFATAVGGLDINDEIPAVISEDYKNICRAENGRIILESASDFHNEVVAPIEPDFIGEFVVLNTIQKVAARKERRKIISDCYASSEFPLFMHKCIDDYYDSGVFSKFFNEFIEILEPLMDEPVYMVRYASIIEKFAQICNINKIPICTKILKQLYETKYQEDLYRKQLAFIFSAHLYNRTILKGCEAGRRPEEFGDIHFEKQNADEALSLFTDLYKECKQDQSITLTYAEALANFSYYSYENAKFAKKELENILHQHGTQIPMIAVKYSMALNNLLKNMISTSWFQESEDVIGLMSDLYRKYIAEADNHTKVCLVLVNAVSDPKLHESVNQEIDYIANSSEDYQKKIIVEYAKGLNNIIALYIKAGNGKYSNDDKQIIHSHFQTLRELYDKYSIYSPQIIIEYAKANTNIILSCDIPKAKLILEYLKQLCCKDENRPFYGILLIRYIRALYHYCCLNVLLNRYNKDIECILAEVITIYENNRELSDEIYVWTAGCLHYIFCLLCMGDAENKQIKSVYDRLYCVYKTAPSGIKASVEIYIKMTERFLSINT